MNTWDGLHRLLAILEHEWDVVGMQGEGSGERQSLTIKFKRKAQKEKDD